MFAVALLRHHVRHKPRKVRDLYPNLIFTTWETVDRPRQVIVSDMTAFKIILKPIDADAINALAGELLGQ